MSALNESPTWMTSPGSTARAASDASKISLRGLRKPTSQDIVSESKYPAIPNELSMREYAPTDLPAFEMSPILRPGKRAFSVLSVGPASGLRCGYFEG